MDGGAEASLRTCVGGLRRFRNEGAGMRLLGAVGIRLRGPVGVCRRVDPDGVGRLIGRRVGGCTDLRGFFFFLTHTHMFPVKICLSLSLF